ncbi:MAG: DUF2812 domain-containing protein [Oscillospiraceae bacterium]|nr:DUF2812 domain-containing protein [Oscillospiraceae bacterium]
MNKKHTEIQTFYISEFEQEQAWLEHMHKNGWRFLHTTGFKYYFEECPKEEYIYQLDFNMDGRSEEEYIRLYEDFGWEFIYRFRKWYYFRKKKTAEDTDLSIFSDRDSKIEMCRKIISHHIKLLLAVLLIFFILPAIIGYITRGPGFLKGMLISGSIGAVIGSTVILNQLSRLRRLIKSNGGD